LLLEDPSLPNSSIQADWAESACLFGKDPSVSRAELDAALTSFGYRYPESIINNIWAEITWRRRVIPHIYPINVHFDFIERRSDWKDSFPYSFMLLLSTNFFYGSTRIEGKNQKMAAKLFERFVSVVLKEYLPRSINIGSPREGRMDRSLKRSLEFFCSISSEVMQDRPQIEHYAKDEDVDVICWNPIDIRSGQIIMLVQCTIEKHWHRSADKIDIDSWKKIVDFAATPCKALAFPYVCRLSEWKTRSTRGGILFDRLRLHSFFSTTSTMYLRKRIIEWSQRQIDSLRWFD
jgi:hypothetical protein